MGNNYDYRIGPCWVFTTSSVTDPFGDWTNLGYTQGNVLATVLDGKVITNTVDQLGDIPIAAALYKFGDSFELSFPLVDKKISTLMDVAPGAVKLTGGSKDVFALSESTKFINGQAWALVPVDEYTEGEPWWESEHAIYVFNGFANIANQIATRGQVQENDLKPFEVTVTHVHDSYGRGGIGALWRLGKDVVGFNDVDSFSFGVTDTDTRDALTADGIDTMKKLFDATSINISAHSTPLTDTTGLKYGLYNTSTFNISDNNFSQDELSDFVDVMWGLRGIMGGNSCVVDLSLNNGVDADAQAKIDGTGKYLYAIQAVDDSENAFTVEGDQRGKFPGGRTFTVENSTGNDGTYTVANDLNLVYDATNNQTRIPVQESIADATADGSVNDGLVAAGCTVTT